MTDIPFGITAPIPDYARDALCDWLREHDIDPADVRTAVVLGDTVHVDRVRRGDDGAPVIWRDQAGRGCIVTDTVDVPLRAPLPDLKALALAEYARTSPVALA